MGNQLIQTPRTPKALAPLPPCSHLWSTRAGPIGPRMLGCLFRPLRTNTGDLGDLAPIPGSAPKIAPPSTSPRWRSSLDHRDPHRPPSKDKAWHACSYPSLSAKHRLPIKGATAPLIGSPCDGRDLCGSALELVGHALRGAHPA